MKSHFRILKTASLIGFALLVTVQLQAQLPEFPVLDSLPSQLDSLPEYEVKAFARRLADQALEVRDIFQQQADRTTLERDVATDQLAASEADTSATADERKILGKKLKTAKSEEKKAAKQLRKAIDVSEYAESVAVLDSAELRRQLPKAYKRVAALIPEPEVLEEPIADMIGVVAVSEPTDLISTETTVDSTAVVAEEPPSDKPSKKSKPQQPERPPIKTYDPKEDVLLNPPARPCVLTEDTRDAFSGELQREVQAEELFRFTNPALRSYFRDREHIICQAALSTRNGSYVLHLYFTVNDANAPRAFGNLPKNGIAILKLLDGETYTVYNLKLDEGKAADDGQSYTYHGQYLLNTGMFKRMQRSYFDKIRIAWSTGYEDYEIYNIDFFMRQLNCLLKS
ncbi:MAG: hypothetical protein EP344_11780 [Bacteroidetes bacterium]|nr:MAG: hypothetical protein EP344_11780 [Bacteroidota bacterium]